MYACFMLLQGATLNNFQKHCLAVMGLGFVAGFLVNEVWDGIVGGDYKKALGCLIGAAGIFFLIWHIIIGQILFFQ